MRVGVITGTGTYALPGLEEAAPEPVPTPYGDVELSHGAMGDVEVAHISRHGPGHRRLSTQVEHRANVAALAQAEVDAVLAVTVCGAVDPTVELGSLIVFDDLHFVSNRLSDGTLCTFHTAPGDRGRGHWIFDRPFADRLRRGLLAGAAEAGHPCRDGGCYGHVDGPRFNTRAEIRGLAACGVTAVSQTAAAEAVLCGEAELPYALMGYVTDYANGVSEQPTPVAELVALIDRSRGVFASTLAAALRMLAAEAGEVRAPGLVYRFED